MPSKYKFDSREPTTFAYMGRFYTLRSHPLTPTLVLTLDHTFMILVRRTDSVADQLRRPYKFSSLVCLALYWENFCPGHSWELRIKNTTQYAILSIMKDRGNARRQISSSFAAQQIMNRILSRVLCGWRTLGFCSFGLVSTGGSLLDMWRLVHWMSWEFVGAKFSMNPPFTTPFAIALFWLWWLKWYESSIYQKVKAKSRMMFKFRLSSTSHFDWRTRQFDITKKFLQLQWHWKRINKVLSLSLRLSRWK